MSAYTRIVAIDYDPPGRVLDHLGRKGVTPVISLVGFGKRFPSFRFTTESGLWEVCPLFSGSTCEPA